MNPTISPAALDAVLVTDGETFFLSAAELVATMANLGHAQIGTVTRRSVRAELLGQPIFSGLVGPMWNDGSLRYETAAVYAQVSQ